MLSLDVIIFLIFLIINLSAGLFYSRGVTSIQQYAIGDRNFSTSSLVATIISSLIGAGFFYCGLIETYRQGLYFIFPAFGDFLGLILIGRVLVKRMGEFLGKLSIAEAMGDLFGKRVKVIVALMGILLSIGTLGNQFKVAAKMLELVFGSSGLYATLFSAAIIILYSTFGGIKAVTLTDVIQFFTFGAIIPAISVIVWMAMTDHSVVFSTISASPAFNVNEVLNLWNPRFYKMIGLLIIFLPVFEPIIFQRVAMCKSIEQASRAFTTAGIVCFCIQFVLWTIAILLLSEFPNLNPDDLVVHIMSHYAYPGFKGIVAVGVMAIIMSTADSLINATAVIFAHDLCKPLGFKWSDNELNVSKIFAVISGVIGVCFALKFNSILDIIILTFGLYSSIVTIPFVLAIFGFRSSETSVLIGMFAGAAMFCIWESNVLGQNVDVDACIPSIIANATFLFTSHYFLNQPGGWVGIKDKKVYA